MNVEEAAKQYIEQLGATRSELTRATYTHAVRGFVEHITPETACSALTAGHFVRFATEVLWNKYARSTVGIYAAVIRGFMKFLVSQELTEFTFQDFVKVDYALENCRPDPQPRKPKVPDEAVVKAMLDAARSARLPSPLKERNIAIVETLYSTGCRIRELAQLMVGDVDVADGKARIVGKRSRVRDIYLSPRAIEACQAYWRARGYDAPDTPAFARHDDGAGQEVSPLTTHGLRRAINELREQANVHGFTPHSFRHFYATRLLAETGNLALVQDALGHLSPETTRIYAQMNPDAVRQATQAIFSERPIGDPAETPAAAQPVEQP
jgi:site-specific recombinase XerD